MTIRNLDHLFRPQSIALIGASIGHDITGQGLDELMMNRLITYARKRGVGEIYGEVLHKNTAMLGLCDKLGFVQSTVPDDRSIVHVSLGLKG